VVELILNTLQHNCEVFLWVIVNREKINENEVYMEEKKFVDLGLGEDVLKSITEMGFDTPSDIQGEIIPIILEGKDVIGQAQTGTGKTLAFAAPILSMLKKKGSVSAIILAPTRELAIQVNEEVARIAKHSRISQLCVYGGSSIDTQMRALKRGVDIVVGTPGRVIDLMQRRVLKLDQVDFLVLDEADEMLNMGFVEDIETIMAGMSETKQTMLFSATMPEEYKRLSKKYMKEDRVHIKVAVKSMTVSSVSQYYYEVREQYRFESLCRIMDTEVMETVLIFCKTKRGVDELVSSLSDRGYNAAGMHGDMTQNVRIATLKKFKEKKLKFLVATDVAARGIDIDNLSYVVNYDLPQDIESYVHRIGRTGRANKLGTAISLVNPRELSFMKSIERVTKAKISKKDIPTLDDIFRSKNNNFKEKIVKEMEGGNFKKFMPVIEEMKETFSIEDVAAALMNMLYKDDLSFDYKVNVLEQPKRFVRLFITVGSMDKLTPKKLIDFITENSKVKPESIGTIDILTKFSFIDVVAGTEDIITEGCNGLKLSGRKAKFEVAAKRRR